MKEQKVTELAILNYIDQHDTATQRELSEHAGVSLGTINLLLKRMVNRGLVKIERLQPNSMKYFLTPSGIADKLERTYGYIVRTYNEIEDLRTRIISVVNYLSDHYEADTIWFFGPRDDFSLLLADLVKRKSFSSQVQIYHQIPGEAEKEKKRIQQQEELQETELQAAEQQQKIPIIVWKEASEKLLSDKGLSYVNIMGMLNV
jgi:DNA-binding PadR family transcriptional regulator